MSIELLAKCGKTLIYKKHAVICREGEPGHSMYIILSGSVVVGINSYSNNAAPLAILQEGSFFGEMSLLEKKPRSATVFAYSDNVIVLEIEEKDFPLLLRDGSSISYHLLCTLNQRLNDMLDRMNEIDKKFVFHYRKNPHYISIQKLNEESFHAIAHENSDYVWTLLKYLSSCLNEINSKYVNYIEQ